MTSHGPPQPLPAAPPQRADEMVRNFFGVFRYSRHALRLVWGTNRALLFAAAALTLVGGLLPAGIAWIGARIVDAVVAAMHAPGHDVHVVLRLVLFEGLLVAALSGVQRGLSLCQALLRAQLGQRVNVMILEKALTLGAAAFRGFRVLRQTDPGPP